MMYKEPPSGVELLAPLRGDELDGGGSPRAESAQWSALLISLVAPGGGHVLLGKWRLGAVLFALFACFQTGIYGGAILLWPIGILIALTACQFAFLLAVAGHAFYRGREPHMRKTTAHIRAAIVAGAMFGSMLAQAGANSLLLQFVIPSQVVEENFAPTLHSGNLVLVHRKLTPRRGDLIGFGRSVKGETRLGRVIEPPDAAGNYRVLPTGRENEDMVAISVSSDEITGVISYVFWPPTHWKRLIH